jgi:hypothetical protein
MTDSAIVFIVILVSALWSYVALWYHMNRRRPERLLPYNPPSGISGGSDAQAQYALTPADRDMVYQTPKWWDQEFHKALESTGAAPCIVIDVDTIEDISFSGIGKQILIESSYLDGCTCSMCSTVKSMGVMG